MSVTYETKQLIEKLEAEMLSAYRKNAGIRSRIEELQNKLTAEKEKLNTALEDEIKIAKQAKYKSVSSLIESKQWKKDLQDEAKKLYKKAKRSRKKTSAAAASFSKTAEQKIEALKAVFKHYKNKDIKTAELKQGLIDLKHSAESINLSAWLKSCNLPARATKKLGSNKDGKLFIYEHMPWD